jgi:hypothetical protein
VSADIIAKGLDLEKLERLDAGEATDRVGLTFNLVPARPPAEGRITP